MAPMKRVRPVDAEDLELSEGSEVVDVESARSTFRADKVGLTSPGLEDTECF